LSGSFSITPTDKTGRDLRGKGRLSYVGKRYLQFEETQEFFLKAGADSPENLLAYEDFDNTSNQGGYLKSWSSHVSDWNAGDPVWQGNKGKGLIGAINYLSSKGMNSISFLTMNLNGDDNNVFPYSDAERGSSPQNGRLRFDVSKLAQWEIVFAHAESKGMYLHFKTQETENDLLLDGGQLGKERSIYYRELIARFGHHLALNWNLGEENDIYQELNDPDQTLIKSYISYIRSLDPYGNHIVLHTYPGQQEGAYTPLLGDSSLLTGASIQTFFNNVHNETKEWIKRAQDSNNSWVVANDEQGGANYGVPPDVGYQGYIPSGDHTSQIDIRKEVLWGNLMAGGAGVEYYFGYNFAESDLTCEDWRSRDSMWTITQHALNFFNQYLPFDEMESVDSLTDEGYAFAKENEAYAFYLPGGSSQVLVDLPGDPFSLIWYNPRTGGVPISQNTVVGSEDYILTPPTSGPDDDWLAFFESAGAVFSVELEDFRIETLSDKTILKWISSIPINFSHFEVERSTDAVSFEKIGQIFRSEDTSPVVHEFEDENILRGLAYYYRLKMLDLDGSFTYSSILKSTVEKNADLRIKIYPNPTQGNLTLITELLVPMQYKVIISNVAGAQIYTKEFDQGIGKQTSELKLGHLAAGLYHLRIMAAGKMETRSFIKQ